MRLEPGTPIDVWCVEQRLGSGGMGAVYRCFNRSAPRIRAALKILDPTLAYDPEIRGRFIREAELLFQLDHPNIVKVRNINMDASPPFIEMAFCQGRPLDVVLSDGALPLGVAALVGAQLCEALAHVHDQGIRHRDVKPGNVIVNGDLATLVDFGIATEGAARTMNMTGGALGTVAYAPPEWGSRTSADPVLWDAYSIGQVVWECLSGRPAFSMPADMDMREGVFHLLSLKGEVGPLDVGEAAPEAVRALVKALTHPDPSQRHGDLREAAAILWRHAEKGTGFLPEVEPLGDPTVAVQDEESGGHSDTMFFSDLEGEEMGFGAPVPNLADGFGASPSAPTIADPTLAAEDTAFRPPPRSRVATAVGIGVVGAFLVGGAILATGFTNPFSADSAPTSSQGSASSRPIQLNLKGEKPEGPVQTFVNGTLVGGALNLAPGPHTFQIVVGEGCEAVEGVRPVWCGVTEREKVVPDGTGVVSIALSYPVFTPSEVSLQFSGASASKLRIDDGVWTEIKGDSVSLSSLAPGMHTLLARGGSCPDEAPCADACPKTCSEAVGEVVVPFEGGAPVALALVMPEREAVKTVARSSGRVTRRQFARWVKAKPEYGPGGNMAKRLSDGGYLATWSVDNPGSGAADAVSPSIAAIYCGRKGLAPVTAAPTSWAEGAISYEIRQGSGGAPVLLHFSGSVSRAGSKQSTPTVGFRCR